MLLQPSGGWECCYSQVVAGRVATAKWRLGVLLQPSGGWVCCSVCVCVCHHSTAAVVLLMMIEAEEGGWTNCWVVGDGRLGGPTEEQLARELGRGATRAITRVPRTVMAGATRHLGLRVALQLSFVALHFF